MGKQIAIDGPAGAGKSTIAKRVAKELGFTYVDTGAMYRALAVYFFQNGISGDDTASIAAAVKDAAVDLAYDEEGVQQVFLNGENITHLLRTEEVSAMASVSSAVPEVRQALLAMQRELAEVKDVVMDGRDIGTVILPDADLKVYLTASVEERARRRYRQLLEMGQEGDLAEIEEDIKERDYRDMHREIAPLKQADDAVFVDSSDMTPDEVTEKILSLFDEKARSAEA